MSKIVSLILNRIFNNKKLLTSKLDHIKLFLGRLNEIVQLGNFNNCSIVLLNALFSMIFNLIQTKIELKKDADLSILNGISDFLIENLGQTNQNNTV